MDRQKDGGGWVGPMIRLHPYFCSPLFSLNPNHGHTLACLGRDVQQTGVRVRVGLTIPGGHINRWRLIAASFFSFLHSLDPLHHKLPKHTNAIHNARRKQGRCYHRRRFRYVTTHNGTRQQDTKKHVYADPPIFLFFFPCSLTGLGKDLAVRLVSKG